MRAKKSLGQNFLNSKTVARDIVRAAELAPGETVIEIGPGKGFLTGELLATGAHVIAVEKDDRMIPLLEEKFADEIIRKQLILVHEDVINLLEDSSNGVQKRLGMGEKSKEKKLGKVIPANSRYRENLRDLFTGTGKSSDGHCDIMHTEVRPPYRIWRSHLRIYKVVANIPYYITGQILRVFLEAEEKPERMILMLQKEVADRIVARDGKESILSIAVKAYGTPRIVKKVPARYFTPAPNVDSAVLAIENISGAHFKDRVAEKLFFEIMKAGFAHKRKQLAGNLKELFGDKTATLLAQAGVVPNARAEDVTLDQWLVLSRAHGGPTSKMRNTISNKMLPIESKNSRRDEEKNAKNIEIF